MSPDSRPLLVVDDDQVLAELLAAILTDVGHEVIIANSGADGIEQARSTSPSLILCDMAMPGMSGVEVLRALRADPTTAAIPFVLMSGSLQTLDGPRPNAFLQKPFMIDEVLGQVGELITPATVAA